MEKRVNVGGQAVIEGVMMRSPASLAVAVRRPDKEIVVKEALWRSLWDRFPFLKWPFFRGTVVMIEAMVNGMQALDFSARESLTEEEKGKDKDGSGSFSMVLPLIVSFILAIGLFKFLPHLAASYSGEIFASRTWTVDDFPYHVVDGIVKIILFIGYVAAISAMKDIRRVFMYHGAEHMAIYTYEAGEELTVENAKKKSRLHPRCGTSFLMVVILIFMLVSALLLPILPEVLKPGEDKPFYTHLLLVLAKLPLLIPVAGISYEFNRFAGKNCNLAFIKPLMWPGMLMQLLTTREPEDDQLEIALVALKTSLLREGDGEVKISDEPTVFKDYNDFIENIDTFKPAEAV